MAQSTKYLAPLYVSAVLIEYLLPGGSKRFRLNDTISSLSAGILTMFARMVLFRGIYAPYTWIRQWLEANGLTLPLDSNNPLHLFAAFLLLDLGYYVGHRAAHECTLFWSGHQAHHSSEEFNLSTALRQGALEYVFHAPFFFPMAMVAPHDAFVFLGDILAPIQFWVHTSAIEKLPAPLEFIFVTPSHHRVHHARNPRYIDRNYGGCFILFDRMFGSFQEELPHEDPCVYGLVHPLQTWNPLHIQWHHIVHIAQNIKTALWNTSQNGGLWNTLKIVWRSVFSSPSIDPHTGQWMEFPQVSIKEPKFDPVVSSDCRRWIQIQFFVVIVPFVLVFLAAGDVFFPQQRMVQAAGAALLTLAVWEIGYALEKGLTPTLWTIHTVRMSLWAVFAVVFCNAPLIWTSTAAVLVLALSGRSFQ